MPRKLRPPDPGEPEPEHTVGNTLDGKSVHEELEHLDDYLDKIDSMTIKMDDESLAAEIRASIAAKSDDELEKIDRMWLAFDAKRPKSRTTPLPERGALLRVAETPAFARVRVTKLGSFNAIGDDSQLLGTTVIMWTQAERNHNHFAGGGKVRGVFTPENKAAWKAGELSWLSGDGEVELIDPPTYAGQPEDIIASTTTPPVELPAKKTSGVASNWPPLIWDNMQLYYAMVPLDDPLNCVETILCALAVAPDALNLRPFLLAGLKERYKEFLRDKNTYKAQDLRWRHADSPRWDQGLWIL